MTETEHEGRTAPALSELEDEAWSWRNAMSKTAWWIWSRFPKWSRFGLWAIMLLATWLYVLLGVLQNDGIGPQWLGLVTTAVALFLYSEVAGWGYALAEAELEDSSSSSYEQTAQDEAIERLAFILDAHEPLGDPEIIVHRSDLERVLQAAGADTDQDPETVEVAP